MSVKGHKVREYRVTYYKPGKGDDYSFWAYEFLNARGIVHAHKLARAHAKDLGSGVRVNSLKQRGIN